jgi:hypothetical protein
MSFQPAGKVCYFNDCSERMLKSTADRFETQQTMESALAIPEGLP